MLNKHLLFISLFIVILLSGCFAQPVSNIQAPTANETNNNVNGLNDNSLVDNNNNQPIDAKQSLITTLAKKYNRLPEEITLNITKEIGDYLQADVQIGTSTSSQGLGYQGLVFANKSNNTWEIIYDGSGAINCQNLLNLNFPREFLTLCEDSEINDLLDNLAQQLEIIDYKIISMPFTVERNAGALNLTGSGFIANNLSDWQQKTLLEFFPTNNFVSELKSNLTNGNTHNQGFVRGNLFCLLTGILNNLETEQPTESQQSNVEVKCARLNQ